MILSTQVLGQHTATVISQRASAPLLKIGRDVFYRRDLARIECFNFTAAANLSKVLDQLDVRNTRDVYDHVPPAALILPRLGSVSLAVLGAAFEAKGLGGGQPLESWYVKHRPKDAAKEFTTFDTLKAKASHREAGERKADRAQKARKHARRDEAQRLRGERYIERHAAAEAAPAVEETT